ncbi:MAG TPA: hypothetical protein VNL37_02145, partial [Candidatus Polarisedimenticolia bacterium]|nr:hypothetical protein [Candidatus Polarisedimenticolia bacterium]
QEILEPETWTSVGVREFARAAGLPLDGVLGVEALRPFRVTIDYPRRHLHLERSSSPTEGQPGGDAVLTLRDGRLLVETRLSEDLHRVMLLDTASAVTLISRQDVGRTRPDPAGPALIADGASHVLPMPRRLLPSLWIGATRLTDLHVVPYDFTRLREAGLAGSSPAVSGIIGADALAGHVVVLDASAGLLRLLPGDTPEAAPTGSPGAE